MTELNNYNRVAPVYDFLARIVFGRSIRQSQLELIPRIPDTARVVVIGGGTGWLARAILQQKAGIQITYVEASSKMIDLAKRKTVEFGERIQFIHGTERNLRGFQFDVAITNFMLDLYAQDSLRSVIGTISDQLAPGAMWFVTDFVDEGKLWQKSLLKVMYLFFGASTRLRTTALPDWHGAFIQGNFQRLFSRTYYRGFIASSIYQHKQT